MTCLPRGLQSAGFPIKFSTHKKCYAAGIKISGTQTHVRTKPISLFQTFDMDIQSLRRIFSETAVFQFYSSIFQFYSFCSDFIEGQEPEDFKHLHPSNGATLLHTWSMGHLEQISKKNRYKSNFHMSKHSNFNTSSFFEL